MREHINYQTIVKNGHPEFVILPYEEFIRLHPEVELEEGIPHEVMRKVIRNNMSRIRAWREYLGYTQSYVAKKMGLSQSALSQIEAIDSNPRLTTLNKLSEIYGISVEQLK